MPQSIDRSLCVLLLAGLPVMAADQVVLTNGDIVSGSIVKKDGATLTIKSEFLGVVSMPWAAVKSIRSDSDLVVVLPGGEAVKGKISSLGDSLQVATGTETRSAPLAGVAAMRDAAEQHAFERLERPRLVDLWAGSFDLGLAMARGNARTTTLTTAFTAARATRKDTLSVYFNQIYASARVNGVNSDIAGAVRGGWKYNHDLRRRAFVTMFNDYEHDRFQNLDLRFAGGLGAGFSAIRSEGLRLDFDAGLNYQRENFFDGLVRNSAEANFGNNLLKKMNTATSVTQSFRLFTNLSNTGEYRINFDLGTVTTLKKWLGWQVTVSDRFLSNPVQGRQRNDLLLSTGFRLTFAR